MILDLIVFEVGTSVFAINLDSVNRISTIPAITPLASANKFIEGMISYESRILHVLSLRTIVDKEDCATELLHTFEELIKQHHNWIKGLENSVENGAQFNGALNAHLCNLGKWIDNFTSYDDDISDILRNLNSHHSRLHNLGADIVELLSENKKEAALELFHTEVDSTFHKTMGAMQTLKAEYKTVADSLQKLLLYKNNEDYFAIKVDKIVDIVHVDASDIAKENEGASDNEYVAFDGVIELNNTLVNVIREITLPK